MLGTLGYMSPEQVRGKPADTRSRHLLLRRDPLRDAVGPARVPRRLGRGHDVGDPPGGPAGPLRNEPGVSPGLERIVRHCLEKNPEQRFHSAHDLAFDLEALSGTSATSAGAMAVARVKPALRIGRPWLAGLAAAALAAGAVAGHFLWKPESASAPTYRRLTFRRGNIGTARFAPDGRTVVYSASWEGQPLEIFTTRPEGPESTAVGVKNSNLLAVSPSGELAISLRDRFLASPLGTGTLATVPLGGGAPRSLAEFVEWADWTPDGKQVAVVRFLEGRNRLELPLGNVLYSSPHVFRGVRISPRGDRVATLERGPEGFSVVTVDRNGKSKTLAGPTIRAQDLTWSPSGEEIWLDDRGEHGQFLLRALDLSGRARTLASSPVGLILHDIARDGRILAERFGLEAGILGLGPGETRERELSWFDGSEPVGLSDDGRLLLFNEFGDAAGRAGAHYLRKTDGSPAVKLGEGEALDLSSDGKWVLARRADSPKNLVLQPTGPGASISIDLGALESVGGVALFPDGKRLLVAATEPGKNRNLYVQDLPTGKPRAISSKGLDFNGHPISPDGRWVAGRGEWTDDLVLVPTDGGESRPVANTKGIDLLCWSSDGGSLFAVESGSLPARVVRIEVATGRREPWKTLAPPQLAGVIAITTVVMTPDGQWYAYGHSSAAISDLYLIEGLK